MTLPMFAISHPNKEIPMNRIALAAIVACFSCLLTQETSVAQKSATSQDSIPHFADYFPLRIGSTFSYTIEMGYVEPVAYEEIKWPEATATRRVFNNVEYTPRKTFLLELKIKGQTKNLGQNKLQNGFEVSVEKDELGVYKNAKQIFWLTDPKHFSFHEIAVCPPNESITPKGFDKDGVSERVLLFQGKAGTKIDRIKYFNNPHDTLTFNGIEKVPGSDILALHFTRHVNSGLPDDPPDSALTDEFEEHSYFAKGKGLVYLEQRIGGNTSMTWRVTDRRK